MRLFPRPKSHIRQEPSVNSNGFSRDRSFGHILNQNFVGFDNQCAMRMVKQFMLMALLIHFLSHPSSSLSNQIITMDGKVLACQPFFFSQSNGLSGLYYLAFGKSFLLIEFFSDVVKLTTCNLSNIYFQNHWVDPLKNKFC